MIILTAAGHGGPDPGAVNRFTPGRDEKVINLEIDQAFYELASAYGHTVYRMRTADTALNLNEIAPTAARVGANVVIEFHVNASPSTDANGLEALVYPGGKGEQLAPFVLHLVSKKTGLNIRKYSLIYVYWSRFQTLASIPHVLTENGFISNPSDEARLKNPETIRSIAWGHLAGIHEYFKLPIPEPVYPVAGYAALLGVMLTGLGLLGAILWYKKR